MNGRLDVIDPGLGGSLQDQGRFGHRALGVPVSGCLDPELARRANALVGNPMDAAVLEIGLLGPGLRVMNGPVRLALTGAISARLRRQGGEEQQVAAWESMTLWAGDCLSGAGVTRGVAYLAVNGGWQTPLCLGSRATYGRADLGLRLRAGLSLPCSLWQGELYRERRGEAMARAPHDPQSIRVVLGPQDDHFTPEAVASFLSQDFFATREQDRMGLRLAGPRLIHRPGGADIVSDGVVPGAIQVPANGQPIVLLADCQTTGGYPKIATVIRADLPRLAHFRPGERLRFVAVDIATARRAWQEQEAAFARWQAGLRTFSPPPWVDEGRLLVDNLIGGALRGDEAFVDLPDTKENPC